MRSKAQTDTSYYLATAPVAQDEPSAEPVYIGEIKEYEEVFAKWSKPDCFKELEKAAMEKEYLREKRINNDEKAE